MMQETDIWEYLKTRSKRDLLVDLRSETLYGFGTIPGAINVPVERIGELYDLPKDRTVCLFCQTGDVSRQFSELLSDAGYNTRNLTGGYREYLRHALAEDKKQ